MVAGASGERGNPLDRVGDLDLAISDLAQREEALLREYERNQQAIDVVERTAAQIRGTGSAEDGAVTVTVDGDNRITAVELAPRALRLGSIERLERAILAAFTAAADDADDGGGQLADPLRQFLDSMPEVTSLLPQSVSEFLSTSEPTKPRRPARGEEPL
ncbi:MAG: YbaB/EbfC family nucleoid-associated protein [Propionibacteriaceae bacterium]